MGHVRLENARLSVVVDGETGAVRAIENRVAGLSLIADDRLAAAHPFMLILADGTILRGWESCNLEQHGESEVQVAWTLERGLSMRALQRLDSATGDILWQVELSNPEGIAVAALAYPYLTGIGRLGDVPAKDELVHPYATGFLVRNPLDALPPIVSETDGQQPVVLGLYPEGFSGSTMQFMAYNAVGRGGFYISTEDTEGREKWLNFYRHPDGDLRLAVWHSPTNYAENREILPPYSTVLAALDGGTWYDAADRYKSWALAQPWAERGPLWARDDRPRWLFETVGLCTFGINPRHDRAPWITEIDRIAGTPVLHLLGPSWPRTEANYHNSLPGGLEDWFPARFHGANLDVIRANGDFVVPFEFNLLFGKGEEKADAAEGARALQLFPAPTLSRDAYDFPYLCPACSFTRKLHVARDRALIEQHQVDGIYYDISVNNVRHICISGEHGHAAGDSSAISSAFKTLLAETATAMREAADGRTIPQGTEMINEQMIPSVWFYQARADGSPSTPFESGPFVQLIKDGHAEKIPLFSYVYHEYGPVRMDGWAKLSREQGDFIYFVLSQVFLQGGLIELNYEFSSLEDLEDRRDVSAEHYWSFDERRFTIDPELAQFVGRLARARIGSANRYLAYGAMCRPAPITIEGEPTLELAYFQYNSGQDWPGYEARGTMHVATVLQTAWRYRDEGFAWLLLNLATEERTVHLELGSSLTNGGAGSGRQLFLVMTGEAARRLDEPFDGRPLTLTLPSRCPIMIEALPV
ncbi:MAG: hypothetical protein JWO42_1822 [Chloroflexi bacterium]|nr:hypothetical protein [Chloroflexota bacterium]